MADRLFLHDTLYAILLTNEIHFKTNKTSVNGMATGVGLACDRYVWRHRTGGGWSREEVWEEECGLPVAQKWKDWKTCSEARVCGRQRVGLGRECVYYPKVTVCIRCQLVPVCFFIARSGVQLSLPHTRVWILWSRLDCKCGDVCVFMCPSICMCVSRVAGCHWIPE